MDQRSRAPAPRCLAVWAVTTGATAALVHVLVPQVLASLGTGAAGVPFDSLLTAGCAVALVTCGLWFWAVTSMVVLEALTRRPHAPARCPRGLRRWVLAACGAGLVLGAAPASADQPVGLPPSAADVTSPIAGLPLPDRPTTTHLRRVVAAPTPSPQAPAGVTVRPGDTLWDIATDLLPAGATAADIDLRWRALWHDNREVIGADPDHIEPHMILRVDKEP